MSEKYRVNDELEKIDLLSLFHMMWKTLRRNLILATVIVAVSTIGSYGWAVVSYEPVYEAYTSFVVKSGNAYSSSYYDTATAEQMGKTFSYIVTSGVLRDVVARDLGVGYVSSGISASVMEGTNLLTISVRDASPEMAYDVLQSVINNYPEVAQYIIGATQLTVVDESGVPTAPVAGNQAAQKAMTGMVLGILIVFVFLLVQSIRCRTIQKGDDLKKIMNASFLGNIPIVPQKKRSDNTRKLLRIDNPRIPPTFVESVRIIRSRLEKVMDEKEAKVLLVTSAIPGEGKSTIAANVAIALANKGSRVILVDGDFRHPSLAGVLGMKEKGTGLYQFLKTGGSPSQVLQQDLHSSVKVLLGNSEKPVGNPLPVIRSKQMAKLVETLRGMADYVIIDTPPTAMLSDTTAYREVADAVLLVVRQDYTEQKEIRRALEAIADVNLPIAGYVLNGAAEGTNAYGYGNYGGYGYRGYGYGYGDNYKNTKKKKEKV